MNTEPVGFSLVANAVASRLAEVVPEGFSLLVRGVVVSLAYQGNELRSVDLALAPDPEDSYAEGVARGVMQLLDDVQTDVIETLWTAWPAAEGHAQPAAAYVNILDGDRVAFGYSYGSTPHLDFTPVAL